MAHDQIPSYFTAQFLTACPDPRFRHVNYAAQIAAIPAQSPPAFPPDAQHFADERTASIAAQSLHFRPKIVDYDHLPLAATFNRLKPDLWLQIRTHRPKFIEFAIEVLRRTSFEVPGFDDPFEEVTRRTNSYYKLHLSAEKYRNDFVYLVKQYCRTFWLKSMGEHAEAKKFSCFEIMHRIADFRFLLHPNFDQERLLQQLSRYRPIFKQKKLTSTTITISPPSPEVVVLSDEDEDKEEEEEEDEKEVDPLDEMKRKLVAIVLSHRASLHDFDSEVFWSSVADVFNAASTDDDHLTAAECQRMLSKLMAEYAAALLAADDEAEAARRFPLFSTFHHHFDFTLFAPLLEPRLARKVVNERQDFLHRTIKKEREEVKETAVFDFEIQDEEAARRCERLLSLLREATRRFEQRF